MAIDKLFRSVEVNNSQNIKGDRCFLFMIILSSLLFSSCSESKLTQCEQIFRIAAEVNNTSKNVSYTNEEESDEMKSWLEAASTMNRAASNIEALHINDGELIKYQNQLATIYRIYSQATYDAVAARENKSLDALEFARVNAQEAGQMQQNLIKDINKYCLNR